MTADPTFWENALQGWAGAVIGGLMTAFGVYWAITREDRRAREERVTAHLLRLLDALADAVEAKHHGDAATQRLTSRRTAEMYWVLYAMSRRPHRKLHAALKAEPPEYNSIGTDALVRLRVIALNWLSGQDPEPSPTQTASDA